MITFLAIWFGCGLLATVYIAAMEHCLRDLYKFREAYILVALGCLTLASLIFLFVYIHFYDND